MLQNETVSMSAVGVGMVALLMGSAGIARRRRNHDNDDNQNTN
jgi:LPXTG-motif cell wall-anchored protein